MLKYSNKPPRRRQGKPVVKAIAPQRKAEEFHSNFRAGVRMVYSGVAVFLVLHGINSALPQPGADAQVGDMLNLSPAVVPPGAVESAVQARLVTDPWAKPGAVCALDESVMLKPGGVLTTMAVRPDGVMLAWNGGATAQGAAACPSSSQFLVSRNDYLQLYKIELPKGPTNPR